MDAGKFLRERLIYMKKIAAVFLILALLLSLASCSDGSGGAFYYPVSAAPSSLDPQFTQGTDTKIIINSCFEGLTRVNGNGEVVPGVAQSWSISPDLLTYTFKLREDTSWRVVKSSNGTLLGDDYDETFDASVTAYDFVFAFRRAVNPQMLCPDAALFFPIKNAEQIYNGSADISTLGVKAEDKYTLTVTLNSPCADFLERLSESVFMPCNEEFFNLTGGRYGLSSEYLLCNGPFYITFWDPEQYITVRKNNLYSGNSEVSPATVSFYFNNNTADIAKKLSLGTYSASVFPHSDLSGLENVNVQLVNDTVYGFCFNCNDSVMSNEAVRLAFCSSIKRDELSNLQPTGDFYTGLVPPCCTADGVNYNEHVQNSSRGIAYNESAATAYWNKALEELGTKKVTVKLLCSEKYDLALRPQLQIWQRVLSTNLAISVEAVSDDELLSRIKSGDYQIALAPVASSTTSTSGFLNSFTTNKKDNVFNYENEEYISLVESSMNHNSSADVINACFAAESHLLNHAVFYPLFLSPSAFVCAEDVEQIHCSASGDSICFIEAKRFD